MRNWTPGGSDRIQGCEWEKDWEDVQLVCKSLDVPCKMVREHAARPGVLVYLNGELGDMLMIVSPTRLIFLNSTGLVSLSRPSTHGQRA